MSDYLSEIIGNNKVKGILCNIIKNGSIPHAFLFAGPEGVGKENTALSFCKEINKSSDPSINNKIIHSIETFSEPYVKYILPLPRGKNETDQNDPYEKLSADEIELVNAQFQKKSHNLFYKIEIPRANLVKISSIRDIKKYLSMNYDDINYRMILISQAHLMNEESQNALLKNLEEPPEGVIFILSTSAPEKLRETIRSRCWKITFQPLESKLVSKILVEKFNIDKDVADEVAPFSSGSTQQAIDLIGNDFQELREKTIRILRYSFARKFNSALLEFEDIVSESDQTKAKLIIRLILFWLNDFQKIRIESDSAEIFFNKHIETLEKFYSKFPNVDIANVSQNIDKISSSFRSNINLNVAINNIVSELSRLTIS